MTVLKYGTRKKIGKLYLKVGIQFPFEKKRSKEIHIYYILGFWKNSTLIRTQDAYLWNVSSGIELLTTSDLTILWKPLIFFQSE